MCYFVFCVWKGAFSHNHEIEISFNEKGYMDKKKRFVASCSYTVCGWLYIEPGLISNINFRKMAHELRLKRVKSTI